MEGKGIRSLILAPLLLLFHTLFFHLTAYNLVQKPAAQLRLFLRAGARKMCPPGPHCERTIVGREMGL